MNFPALRVAFASTGQRLQCLVHGADPVRRDNTRRMTRIAELAAVASLLLLIGNLFGLAPTRPVAITLAYNWTCTIGLYALVRSGVSTHWKDPSLSFASLMLAIGSVVLSYWLISLARGAALEILCLLLAYGMDRLSAQQMRTAALGAIGLLTLVAIARILSHAKGVRASDELINLVMAAVLLPIALAVGKEIARLHSRQISQRHELSTTLEKLKALASRDALTGLRNRREMQALVDAHEASGAPFCLALLDIDWFKTVNDRYGHARGDIVLHTFARIVEAGAGTAATVARWGGEEFLVFLPGPSQAEVRKRLDRLLATVRAHDWGGLGITCSAGACAHLRGAPVGETVSRADRALYRAKSQGRDRVVFDAAAEGESVATPVDEASRVAPARPEAADGPAAAHGQATASSAAKTGDAGATRETLPATASVPLQRRRGDAKAGMPGPASLAASATATDESTPHPRLRAVACFLVDLVASRSQDVREFLRLPLLAVVLHTLWLGIMVFYLIPAGEITREHGHLIFVCDTALTISFYLAIRSGWTRRFQDGGLVMPQMLAGFAILMYGYVVAPAMRPSILHQVCVVLVFGMATLTPVASRIAGRGALVCLLAALATLLCDGHTARMEETLKLSLACFVVSRLSALSQSYSVVRQKVTADQRAIEGLVAQVQEQVVRDALTGLFNRQYMEDLLAAEQRTFDHTGRRFCVAMIDLDHFKRINDSLGHQVGDDVLVGLANASTAVLRESEVLCRWGGEEFLLLLRDTSSPAHGLVALARLREDVARLRIGAPGDDTAGDGVRVTFSAGIASIRDVEDVERLLERADRALYAAKAQGRDRAVVAAG